MTLLDFEVSTSIGAAIRVNDGWRWSTDTTQLALLPDEDIRWVDSTDQLVAELDAENPVDEPDCTKIICDVQTVYVTPHPIYGGDDMGRLLELAKKYKTVLITSPSLASSFRSNRIQTGMRKLDYGYLYETIEFIGEEAAKHLSLGVMEWLPRKQKWHSRRGNLHYSLSSQIIITLMEAVRSRVNSVAKFDNRGGARMTWGYYWNEGLRKSKIYERIPEVAAQLKALGGDVERSDRWKLLIKMAATAIPAMEKIEGREEMVKWLRGEMRKLRIRG